MAKLLSKLKQGLEQRFQPARRPDPELQQILAQANRLVTAKRAQETIDLLTPLKQRYSRVADLHYYLGYASALLNDRWGALVGYEQALALSNNADYWQPLASIYIDLELRAHTLTAFRQVQRQMPEHPIFGKVSDLVTSLENLMRETADDLGCPVDKFKQACQFMERGQIALHQNDFAAVIQFNQRALRLVEHWPPPRNNLALAYFYSGQPTEAIAAERTVLTYDPVNLQALSNLIRFLDWTGETEAAQALWPRLEPLTPLPNTMENLKKAEALAVLQNDQAIRQLLAPLTKASDATAQEQHWQIQFFLAVAEANTGDVRSAKRRLRALQNEAPWTGRLLTALQAGKTGAGFATRYPYFHTSELLPRAAMDEFVKLVGRHKELSARAYRKQIDHFASRYPQLVRVGEKLIWEEEQVDAGIAMLQTLATPAAYAVLRRFGLSQAGDDEPRLQVIINLQNAGQLAKDEIVRVWQRGKWQEVQVRPFEITEERDVSYSPRVADLINRGLDTMKRDDDQAAEKLLRQAVTLDPRAKEAYNNLGVLYTQRNDRDQARAMFQAAADIDPTYVFPRANLAIFLLEEKDIEGAKAMIKPLTAPTRRTPDEMAFYLYIQARVQMAEGEYAEASHSVALALQMNPDLAMAKSLQAHLERVRPIMEGMKAFQEQQDEQHRKQRLRLQGKLTTAEPSLSAALALYSKEVLLAMVRTVLPEARWSGLRKAELHEEVVAALVEPVVWQRVIPALRDEERRALQAVLAQGGCMAWSEFNTHYGNDLEESPHWQYHETNSVMGRLRRHGLLVEATVNRNLLIVIPIELRPILQEILTGNRKVS